jgi:PAS domain S-box-containing protein
MRRIFWLGFLVAGALTVPVSAGRLTFTQAEMAREFLADNWQTEDGLPQNSATAMVQTADGYLWFSTFNGLVRFNGQEFRVFTPANTPGLPSAFIANLHLDPNGRLWASTDNGIACLQEGRWRAFRQAEGWTAEYAHAFASDGSGQLFVTGSNGRIYRFSGGGFEELPAPPGPSVVGYSAHVDAQGALWVVNPGFFGCWRNQAWEAFTESIDLDGDVQGFTARDGSFCIVSGTSVQRFAQGRRIATVRLQKPLQMLWGASEDSAGRIWASSFRNGMFRIGPDGRVENYTSGDGLTHSACRFMFEDREGNIWIGTDGGGLIRFKRRNFITYGTESGLPEPVVKTVWAESAERLLLGTHGGGAAACDGHDVHAWPLPGIPPLEQLYIGSIIEDRRGWVWVGKLHGGFSILKPDGTTIAATPDDSPGENIYALYEDSRGRIWIGGNAGASVYDGAQFRRLGAAEGLSARSIRCFTEDPTCGQVWAAAYDGGLFRWEDTRFRKFGPADGLLAGQFYALAADADGTIWIGTVDRGLVRWKDGRFASITEQHGLPTGSIGSILVGDAVDLWMGSNRGVLRARRADLEAVADGRRPRLDVERFTLSDGLESVECTRGYQPAAVRAPDGRLWFATLRGVTVVDPSCLRRNAQPPPVVIEDVTFYPAGAPAAQAAAPCGDAARAPLTLPPGSRQMEIHFAALSYTTPEKVRFQTRLAGRDQDWSDPGERRVASLPLLPPGSYSFRVRAANEDGVWNETGATLDFVVEAFFWKTRWFRGLVVVLAVSGAAASGWTLQQGKLRRQGERLRQEQILRQSKEQYQLLAEQASDGILVLDPQGRLVDVNSAGCRMLGFSRDALLGRGFADLVSAEDRPRVSPAIQRLVDGETTLVEWLLQARDGTLIPVEIGSKRLSDGRLQAIVRDITDRRRQFNTLRQQHDELQAIYDGMVDGILIADVETQRFVRTNPAMCRMLGYTEAELLSKAVADLHPLDRRVEVRTVFDAMAEGRQDLATALPLLRKDGTVLLADIGARVVSFGGRQCAIGFFRDRTQELQVAMALQESEQRFRAMAAAAPIPIVISREVDGVVLYANDLLGEMFGVPTSAVMARPTPDWYADPADRTRLLALLQAHGHVRNHEVRARKANGTVFWIEVSVQRMTYAGQPALIAGFSDIDARKRTEDILRRQALALESLYDAVLVTDLHNRITDWNSAAERMFGYTKAEILGCSPEVLDRAEEAAALTESIQHCLRAGRRWEGEYRFVRKDGTEGVCDTVVVPVFDRDGRRLGAVSVDRDITERKRAYAALAAAKARLEHIIAVSPGVIYVCSADGDYPTTFISRNVLELYGYPPSAFLDDSMFWSKRLHPEDAARVSAGMEALFRAGHLAHEYRFQHADGTYRWTHDQLRLVRDAEGRAVEMVAHWTDITARKQAEEELRRKSEELDNYFSNSLDLLCIADTDGYFRRVNPEWEKALGYPLRELEGRQFLDLVHPEDLPATRDAVTRLVRQGAVLNFINRYRRKDGSYRWIEWRSSSPVGSIINAVARDITDRKLTEEALRAERDFSAYIIHHTPAVICGIAPDGTTTFVNPAGERATGYRAAELIGRNWWQMFYPGDQYRQVEKLLRDMAAGDIRDYEMVLTARDGTQRTIAWNAVNRLDPDGWILEIIGFGHDVTERKRAEAALRESEEKFRTAAEALGAALIICQGTHIVYANPAAQQMSGYTLDELRAMPFWEIAHPEFRGLVQERGMAHQRGGTTQIRYDMKILTKQGVERWMDVSSAPVMLRGQSAVLVTALDTTEQKRAEALARTHQVELAHLNRVSAMGQMTAQLAHELNQPLTTIANYAKGGLHRIRSGGTPSTALALPLEKIAAEATRASQIIRRTRDLIRRQDPRREAVEVNALIREVCELARYHPGAGRVRLELALADALPPVVADRVQVEQVVLNLLSNAIEAVADVPLRERWVTVSTLSTGEGGVEVAVGDNGVGLPPEAGARVFEPFFTTRPGGMGMGLTICQSIVTDHGGRIWAAPNPERGTTFRFTLPGRSAKSAEADEPRPG